MSVPIAYAGIFRRSNCAVLPEDKDGPSARRLLALAASGNTFDCLHVILDDVGRL